MKKRIISILLTACMITALLPVMGNGVFAAGGLTRAEWITQLVAAFEMTVEDDSNMPDNYFSDISEDDSHYRDILLAVEFGVIDLEAGEAFEPNEPATREFAAQTLNSCMKYQLDEDTEYTFSEGETVTYPDDIQIAINRGWFTLSGGSFLPEQAVTPAEAEAMLADAKAVIAGDVVDENYNSQYEFADGVIVVPETADVTIEGEYIVTIADWGGTINTDDIFVVYSYGIPVPLKAETVETGETTVITATKEGAEDAIVSSDAQGSIELDLENFEFNDYTTYSVMDTSDPNAQPEEMTFELQSVDYDKKTKVLTASQKINLGSAAVGTISVKIMNMVLDHKESFFEGEYKAAIRGDAVITTAISFDLGAYAGIPHSIPLGSTRILGLCDIALNMEYDIKGGVTATWTGELSAGASYSRTRGGFRMSSNFIKKSFDLNAHAEIQAGLKLSAKINLPHFKVDAWATAGVRMYADITTHDSGTPKTCVTISGYLYVNVGASAYVDYLVKQESFFKQYDIYDEYNSPVRVKYHYEDDVLVPGCTRGLEVKYHTPTTSRYYNPYSNKSSYGGGIGSGGEIIEPVVIWEYTVDDSKNATITKYSGNASAITIPAELDGYKVTGIAEKVFQNNQQIKSVTMTNNIMEIGHHAFDNCKNIYSVYLSRNLKTLGYRAFQNCSSLTEIEIPKSLTSTTSYYDTQRGVFVNSGLRTVTFEAGTTQVVNSLFEGANNPENVTLLNTMTQINSRAFHGCTSLNNINIPESVTTIGTYGFAECTALKTVELPDYITEIEHHAFDGCTNLSNVKLPEYITTLGYRAFQNCSSLTEIEIPKSLTSTTSYYDTQRGVFVNSGLKTATFEAGTTQVVNSLFEGANNLENVTLLNTMTQINSHAFHGCTSLNNINIPESVTIIGTYGFAECTALETIELPDYITEIEHHAFDGCKNLSNVKLPKYITTLGYRTFQNCQSLTEIEIPKSLSTITSYYGTQTGVFNNSGLKKVTFENGTGHILADSFREAYNLENVVLLDSMTSIGNDAFYDCTSLKSISIPDSVTSIGNSIFNGCTHLENIKLPISQKSITSEMFRKCSNLSKIELPETITEIDSNAFRDCSTLENITLPKNLKTIKNSAFEECTKLESINIPEGVTSIGSAAFFNCDSLESFTANINGYIEKRAFYDCDALESVLLGNGVTSVGTEMCYSCDKFTNVTLGRGITTIPDSAFRQCASLAEVTLPRFCTTVASNAFAEDVKLTTVNVPVSVSKIETNSFSYPTRMTFNGKTGSYAEEYASSRNIKFNAVDAPITTIKYADSKMSIGRNETIMPALTIEPEFDTDTVTFSLSDENILRVSDIGAVTSRNYGTAKITATTGSGKSTSIDITIVKIASSLSLNASSLNLDLGAEGKLTVTMNPSDAVDVLEWSSSNGDIAEVDQDGNVTAKAKGTAVITVKASYSGVSATCTVTVIPPAEITAFTVDESENGYTANITTADVPACAAVWVVAYDTDNRLVGIQKVTANKAVQAEFDTPDAASFKAFVWNMTTLKPLTNSKEAPVTTGI